MLSSLQVAGWLAVLWVLSIRRRWHASHDALHWENAGWHVRTYPCTLSSISRVRGEDPPVSTPIFIPRSTLLLVSRYGTTVSKCTGRQVLECLVDAPPIRLSALPQSAVRPGLYEIAPSGGPSWCCLKGRKSQQISGIRAREER
ncbi:hypothetical protein F4802DRAFT_17033 [Xylaria palmicola]|nr:hypothetical protein F4802DRAFT_17033 [Xylaria palmicola]